MIVDRKNITELINLSEGFILFETDVGYYLGYYSNNEIVVYQKIDLTTYRCMERREKNE